jgi:hypothetical protein
MISFGFEDFYVGDGFAKGFKEGATFRGLSDVTSYIEDFFLAAGTKAKAGAGTRGIETEAGLTLAIETFGTVGVVGTAGIEAKVTLAVGIVEIAGIIKTAGAGIGTGVARGIEAFSYARLNKNSR